MSFQFFKSPTFVTAVRDRASQLRQELPNDGHARATSADASGWVVTPEQMTGLAKDIADDGAFEGYFARLAEHYKPNTTEGEAELPVDQFIFASVPAPEAAPSWVRCGLDSVNSEKGAVSHLGGDGRPDPDTPPPPDPGPLDDGDPDPAPPPLTPPAEPPAPTNLGRPGGSTPGTPTNTPPTPAPGDDNADYGRPEDAMPDVPPPGTGPLTSYTSGGTASSSYNVTIEFVGTWTTELQDSFIDAADYLSTIILADLPDVIVDGVMVDDIVITATLEAIDGVGGTLGSAGPRAIRGDGTYLPSTGAMTFDSADAQNQLGLGNWESIVLHEMMHAMGFGTLWSLMGLVSGSVAGGDIRFTGQNAIDTYNSEFPGIAGSDPDSFLGVPVETDGGPGTAGGHWDEVLFDAEIMTGYVDQGSFVSDMTIAALEDMGYDTVFDNPYSATDLFGPIPADPLMDLFA